MEAVNRALLDAGGDPLRPDELIALCVPTRNVETWALWLCGRRDLDEATDYKTTFANLARKDSRIRARTIDAWFSAVDPKDVVIESSRLPSLTSGRAELVRLRALAKGR
jgi:hypothetical protein